MELSSPDGSRFASERNHNLFIRRAGGNQGELLTDDGRPDEAWTVEFAKWSHDGARLAATRSDERCVPNLPVVRYDGKALGEVSWVRRGSPGGARPEVELFVFDLKSKRRVHIDVGSKRDQQVQIVGWLPDGSALLFVLADRRLKKLRLMSADPVSGSSRPVAVETQPTFVGYAPLITMASPEVKILAGGRRFLWFSERDGWNRLELRGFDGSLVQTLSPQGVPATRVVELDETNGWVYYFAQGDPERPYDTHIYRCRLDGSATSRLTDAPGQHDLPQYLSVVTEFAPADATFSPSKRFFLDTHSDIDRPPAVELRRDDGSFVMTLSRADTRQLQALGWTPPERFVAKADDGKTDLHGLI